MMQSLNALLLLLGRRDIGTDLFHVTPHIPRPKPRASRPKINSEVWLSGTGSGTNETQRLNAHLFASAHLFSWG